MKANKCTILFQAAGLLLVVAALCLTAYNLAEQVRGTYTADRALNQILARASEPLESTDPTKAPEEPDVPEGSQPPQEIPDYLRDPGMEMPEVEIDGEAYIGILTIPALELKLPVLSQWSYARLKLAPCRYQGSAYLGNLIVMAHNYLGHFGALPELRIGDEVFFEDMAGNVFRYQVVEMETLDAGSVEDMAAGDWDLTLFTCTVGGDRRITIRCQWVERQE